MAPRKSAIQRRPKRRLKSLGCWSTTAIPIKRSSHSVTCLLAPIGLYERGVPVRLAFDQIQWGAVAQVMTPDVLVLMAHTISRPYELKEGGTARLRR